MEESDMMCSTPRVSIILTVAAAVLALSATATISDKGVTLDIHDDPNPVGSRVQVNVVNPEAYAQSAYVEVRAWLGEIPARSVEPVTVDPYGSATVYVPFGSEVTSVIHAGIIEDPDPIPAKS
jgi:hypothetical protein